MKTITTAASGGMVIWGKISAFLFVLVSLGLVGLAWYVTSLKKDCKAVKGVITKVACGPADYHGERECHIEYSYTDGSGKHYKASSQTRSTTPYAVGDSVGLCMKNGKIELYEFNIPTWGIALVWVFAVLLLIASFYVAYRTYTDNQFAANLSGMMIIGNMTGMNRMF